MNDNVYNLDFDENLLSQLGISPALLRKAQKQTRAANANSITVNNPISGNWYITKKITCSGTYTVDENYELSSITVNNNQTGITLTAKAEHGVWSCDMELNEGSNALVMMMYVHEKGSTINTSIVGIAIVGYRPGSQIEVPDSERIKRVWISVEGKEFEGRLIDAANNIYSFDIPAIDVYDENHVDDIYRLSVHAKDWADNETVVTSNSELYGRYLEIEITEAVIYDAIEEDPLIPPLIPWLLNKEYTPIRVIDQFESFIWTERFNQPGDFELYLPMDQELYDDLKIGYYLGIKESDRLMIIEKKTRESNATSGHHIKVSGRSLESILDRRIIWQDTELKGNFQDGIWKIFRDNFTIERETDENLDFVFPPDYIIEGEYDRFDDEHVAKKRAVWEWKKASEKRKIKKFEFEKTDEKEITDLKIFREYLGDNVLDLINDICAYKDIGYKILPKGKGGFLFKLYAGINRSYDQTENPWVIFSPYFENLTSSELVINFEDYKNVALLSAEFTNPLDEQTSEGEEETSSEEIDHRVFVEVISKKSESSDLERREIFIDTEMPEQGDFTDEYGNIIPDEDLNNREVDEEKQRYLGLMRTSGLTQLKSYQDTEVFTGEIEPVRQFVYGEDFFIGDIVQIEDQYNMKKVMRIGELTRSHDQNGIITTPSFVEISKPEIDSDYEALAPKITITNPPTSEYEVENSVDEIDLTGFVMSVSTKYPVSKLTVNGRSVRLYTVGDSKTSTSKSFDATKSLTVGENKLTFIAYDEYGMQSTPLEYTVIRASK